MIKNRQKLEEFERRLQATEKLSYKKALRIYDAMYKEAIALGAISHENIWDGFEAVLRISRAINGLPAENFKNWRKKVKK